MSKRSRALSAIAIPALVAAAIAASPTAAQAACQSTTYNYTGSLQYFTVPRHVTALTITVDGASGGNGEGIPINTPGGTGGLGGSVQETLPVFGGQLLQIDVGGRGQDAGFPHGAGVGGSAAGGASNGGTGGYGDGNDTTSGGSGGGGGAASEVDILGNPVIGTPDRVAAVAAGGGGGGGSGAIVLYYGGPGGAGGQPATGGTGGTGLGAGGGGTGGTSANPYGDNGGSAPTLSQGGGAGGGGGGYSLSGGGAGQGGSAGGAGAGGGGGGGGGLSYAELPSASFGHAPSAGDGRVTVSWTPESVSDVVTVAPNPVVAGHSVTLTDTASSSSADGPAPTGSVTFYANLPGGAKSLGTATLTATDASVATASITTSALPAGDDGVYAVYGGDTTYASDTSAVVDENVANAVPRATITPSDLDFGRHGIGTSTTKIVTVKNSGTGPLIVNSLSESSGPFKISANTCGGRAVAPGKSCTVSIVFRSTSAGSFHNQLSIADNATGSPRQVSLSGTAVRRPAVTRISPSHGSKHGRTRVTITGTDLSHASAVSFGSHRASSFSCSATSCRTLSPSGSGTVDVTVQTAGGTSAHTAADRYRYTS